MPKLKTKKAAAKRFSVTGTGKLVHPRSNHQHKTGKMSAKRKMRLRKSTMTDKTNVSAIKRVLPYL